MTEILITETNLVARLFKYGVLKYFDKNELCFIITDLSFNQKSLTISNDRTTANSMIKEGILKIVSLGEKQMISVGNLYQHYKPKFTVRTIAGLVYASENNLKIISEDELLRDVATEIGIKAYDKEGLITKIVDDIAIIGISLDLDLVREII